MGLYMGCLAIRKSGAGACTVVRVEKVRGNIATIVPSTSASRCSSDSGRSALSPSYTQTSKIRLLVEISALVLVPVEMLRKTLEVAEGEERGFGRGVEKVAKDRGAAKMSRGGEGKKKSKVTFQQDASGGGGDFLGDGEVKGNFASEDIRMKRNSSAKVDEQSPCSMAADAQKARCLKTVQGVLGGELITWMEGLKSSNMLKGQRARPRRGGEVIVDVGDEAVEEEIQDDCFGEKNVEDWMKELQVKEERCSPVNVSGGGVVDADDEGDEELHTSADPCAGPAEPELEKDCSSTGLSLSRQQNMLNPVDTHSVQDCPPVYLMKKEEVHRVKIFVADTPFNLVGRPVELEKEYQDLLDDLSSRYSLRSPGTCLPIEGSYVAARVQGKGWVRVKVQEVTKGSCRVLLIDLGWETWLPPSLLQPLLPSHCNLPQLAQVFHLNSVSPVGGGRKWTKSSIEQLQSEVLHAEVEVTVLGPPVSSSSNALLPSYPVSIDVPILVAVNPMKPSVMVHRNLGLSLIEAGMALPARKRLGPIEIP